MSSDDRWISREQEQNESVMPSGASFFYYYLKRKKHVFAIMMSEKRTCVYHIEINFCNEYVYSNSDETNNKKFIFYAAF